MEHDMQILRYRPKEWVKAFKSECSNLQFLLPQFKINVEHIGATAVPNCRSFRNVDILLSTHEFKDIHTIAMMLETKEYVIVDQSDINCVVLAKKRKVLGERITVRVVQYASNTFNRFHAFDIYLRESIENVYHYNIFRENLFREVAYDIPRYNQAKYDYINNHIDEHFTFEE